MDKRFNFFGHSNSKKVWWINGEKFMSDSGTNNGKQKAIAYARTHMLDDKDIKKFDSEMEFKRFLFLKHKLDCGEISDLKDHFNFQLLPLFENANGVIHEELLYEADFYYFDKIQNKYVVEDVKGLLEDVFRVKWKLFDRIYAKHGLCITCIRMRSGRNINPLDESSWYSFSEMQKSTKRVNKIREENKELKRQIKEREIKERKEVKEKLRLAELLKKTKLTKAENARLIQLQQKYGVAN